MKIIHVLFFFILILSIQAQNNNETNNNNNNNTKNNSNNNSNNINNNSKDNKNINTNNTVDNSHKIKKQDNIIKKEMTINNTNNSEIKKTDVPDVDKVKTIQKNSQNPNNSDKNKANTKQNNIKQNKENIKINTNLNNTQKEKEDKKNVLKEGIIFPNPEIKPFNLTESLINFFLETFGNKSNTTNTTKEAENKKKLEEEEKKRKEEQAKIEQIKMEDKKKKEKEDKFLNERLGFLKILLNNTFEEVLSLTLLKGEKETLYLDLESFTKIKIAIAVTDIDQQEKFNFFFSGPNARGRTAVIYQLYNKNYIFWEYETLRKGEFYAEITNKGTKDNEIYFYFSQLKDKKNDNINTEKIDKISMLLNEIDKNVNEVRNKKTGEIRACKHLSKLSIKNLKKFELEISILINTDHQNIIKLYEIFESQRSLYLVMQECKGGEVFDRIIEHIQKKEMYSEKDAANIFQKLMCAVEYCHNHGICHRDLKPENLLYLNEGKEEDNPIKVIDFGLSQLFHGRRLSTKVGTAYYVAPEILKGDYTEKCDIWSAGVILYILLSGDPPFNGPDDASIYAKIANMNFSFPEKKWKNISNEAKDLITHMICSEDKRYDAKEVLKHKWFQNASNKTLSDFDFDPKFLFQYQNANYLKKLSLLFIASRLDDNEIKDLNEIFSAFDQDKDGQISIKELKQGFLQLKSIHLDEHEINNLFKSIDVDKNNKIDYTEFLAATISEKNYLKRERLLEVFCILDKDGNGKITKEELMEVLKTEKTKEKEIEKYIKVADTNGDGIIDYIEFMKLMGFEGNIFDN